MVRSKSNGPASCLACIDITGGDRRLDAIAVLPSGVVEHEQLNSINSLRQWVQKTQPQVIAIDGPSSKNKRLTRDPAIRRAHGWGGTTYWNMRVAEAVLSSHRIGLYRTPPLGEAVADRWIRTGWSVYASLLKEGYRIWKSPGDAAPDLNKRWAIEVHPNACFVAGLGYVPPNKETIAGSIVRVAYVNSEAQSLGWNLGGDGWPGDGWLLQIAAAANHVSTAHGRLDGESILAAVRPLLRVGHDVVDCLGGLMTAARFALGQAYCAGHERESVIVLPRALPDDLFPTLAESLAKLPTDLSTDSMISGGMT